MARIKRVRLRLKAGKYWQLDWADEGGVRHRPNIGTIREITRQEAEAQRAAKELEINTGKRILTDPLVDRPTPVAAVKFDELADHYLDWRADKFPDSNYRVVQLTEDHLVPFFGLHESQNILQEDVDEYVRRRRASKVKTATINTELKYLRAILHYGVKKKLIKADPLPDMEKPQVKDSKPPEFFTKDELKKLYAASHFESWHAPVWKLLANTGMRRMEAMHAQWTHVREDHIRVLSTEDERTKSREWRSIPLSPGAKEALQELKKITGRARWLLPRVAPESLSRAAIKCIKRASLSGSLHSFRHTFISHLVMQGVPLRTIQKLAGHSRIEVTERYAHLAPDHLEKATSKLNL